MRIRYSISFLLIATCFVSIVLHLSAPRQHGVEIFVMDGVFLSQQNRFSFTDATLATVKLPSTATVLDSEVVEYDWETHTITLTPEGCNRLPRSNEFSIAVPMYFIFSVNRKPCYMGCITNRILNFGTNYPAIVSEDLPTRGGPKQVDITIKPKSLSLIHI